VLFGNGIVSPDANISGFFDELEKISDGRSIPTYSQLYAS